MALVPLHKKKKNKKSHFGKYENISEFTGIIFSLTFVSINNLKAWLYWRKKFYFLVLRVFKL